MTLRKAKPWVISALILACGAVAIAQQAGIFTSFDAANADGVVRTVTAGVPVDMNAHPFWQPIGTNGRSCATCHNPSDGMGLSLNTIQKKFIDTQGSDPLFSTNDGADCPTKPRGTESSHRMLLKHGAIRIARPWPPQDSAGKAIEPEFTIEVVNDPSGCNLDPEYGIAGTRHEVSVFRRPRMTANLGFILAADSGGWSVKKGIPLEIDPTTGAKLSGNLMADGRLPTLSAQVQDAFAKHLQGTALSAEQLNSIVDLEQQLYTAQVKTVQGAALPGPDTLKDATKAPRNVLGVTAQAPIFPDYEGLAARNKAGETAEQTAALDSVARGYDVYKNKTFVIKDVANLNSIGIGNPVKNSCNTCHNHQNTGNDLAPGFMDIGVANQPHAALLEASKDYPLFRIVCKPSARPHPYLGREILTNDPGTALVTGKCEDVGSLNFQQIRALAARAPYFTGGAAPDLRAVVDYYDKRFDIGYTEQEIQDLVNFLKAL